MNFPYSFFSNNLPAHYRLFIAVSEFELIINYFFNNKELISPNMK